VRERARRITPSVLASSSLRPRAALLVLIAALVALLAGPAPASAAPTASGSVEQVMVTGATAGARVTLLDVRGRRVATRRVNRLGAALFRDVRPGRGYRLRGAGTSARRLTVLSRRSAPRRTRYRQSIPTSGYGYLTTRDGIKLAINVRLPAGGGPEPYPTLIEYSGYGYARDPSGESSIAAIAAIELSPEGSRAYP